VAHEPLIFIVSAPSGAGKTSLCREVVRLLPDLCFSVSITTRAPRSHEKDGVDYHFVSLADFRRMIETDQLLEWTEIYGNFYGTSRAIIEGCSSKGMDMLFDIDQAGARRIKEIYPASITIYILPPSQKDLQERLIQRGTEDEAVMKKRLDQAQKEIEQSSWYQYKVVNDDFGQAVLRVLEIIAAERARKRGKFNMNPKHDIRNPKQ
jgi:guanylate kinase